MTVMSIPTVGRGVEREMEPTRDCAAQTNGATTIEVTTGGETVARVPVCYVGESVILDPRSMREGQLYEFTFEGVQVWAGLEKDGNIAIYAVD